LKNTRFKGNILYLKLLRIRGVLQERDKQIALLFFNEKKFKMAEIFVMVMCLGIFIGVDFWGIEKEDDVKLEDNYSRSGVIFIKVIAAIIFVVILLHIIGALDSFLESVHIEI